MKHNGWTSLAQLKNEHADADGHWFSPGAMRFFNSKLHGDIVDGRYFVSSEKGTDGVRRYTVHAAKRRGKNIDIDNVGEFQQYASLRQARAALKAMTNELSRRGVTR